jgi:hypothetical protein
VRQGDPLSPMLFILAFDPLQRILDLASEHGVLTPLPLAAAKLRTSLYADDAAIFINPTRNDLQAVKQILNAFGAAMGLTTNFEKSSIHPIRCENVDLSNILQPFPGCCKTFPCQYLGLQLHTRPLQKIHVQPLVEKIGQRLAGWKGPLLNRAGRLTLVSSVLSSMPIYHLTIFPLARWATKQIDKIRRSFLWKGEDNVHGGHCLVNWKTVARPKDLGGLGVLDLEKFGRALRLRWLWQEWTDSSKPWEGLQVPCNKLDRLLFQASTTVVIGNGIKAKFWHHGWLDGEAPRNLAPHLFKLIRRKNKSVAQELTNSAWIQSLRGKITTTTQLEEFVYLWTRIRQVSLQPDVEDTLVWKWTQHGIYSSSSAYRAQFLGSYINHKISLIWRARTENKCKFFAWVLIQNKLLTADNPARREWPHHPSCALCNGPIESGLHLCLTCPFAHEVWNTVLAWESFSLPQHVVWSNISSISEWWEKTETLFPQDHKREFNGLVIYTMWNLWKERNRRIFEHCSLSPLQIAGRVRECVLLYKSASSRLGLY